MAIRKFLHGVEGKTLSRSELRKYFDAPSLDALLLDLRQYRRSGYFDFEVNLSREYFEWERARYDFRMNTDVLESYDPFGAMRRSPYRITIKADTPLSEDEIIDVITKLPNDMAEKYLRFKFDEIDKPRLRELIQALSIASDEKEFNDLEYGGLVVDDAQVTYFGTPVPLGFQQQQVLRALMEQQGGLVYRDELIRNPDIFNPSKDYPDPNATLSKLVSEVHTKLRKVVNKPCILNTPKEGWRLQI